MNTKTRKPTGKLSGWTASDPRWQSLNAYQKAAAMSLMEADGRNKDDARNALGAMVNRAKMYGTDLGDHVSRSIYQPTIEASQQARLHGILQDKAFPELTGWAERRWGGQEPDPVSGATHFLAHPNVMLKLSGGVRPDGRGSYVGNSTKYRSWPRWTGYNPETNQYRGQVHTDKSHAFLIPAGYGGNGGAPSSTPTIQGDPGYMRAATPEMPQMQGDDAYSFTPTRPQPTGERALAPGYVDTRFAPPGASGDGWRNNPPMVPASGGQSAPQAAQAPAPQPSQIGPRWIDDHYGQGVQWGNGDRSYMSGGSATAGMVTGSKAGMAAPPAQQSQPQNFFKKLFGGG